ncbi:NH(3)-dependent NAD(+) synthetase [Halovenus aranensis]|uniref:Glutamine-dependent NAD(+) synthetase n=1 Tax=Halovenus aranensis TaxID=890420 RepID=A0A1G8T0Q8_9EURY|nr:NAD+ synthase [Halovenus aranensis]SDJ35037.1 NH(3)-dependent NAD(+) synthetase [Halovenus aranensis]
MARNVRVAIVQHNPVVGDVAGNAERLADEYTSVCAGDPDFVVTPELSLLGYPPRDLLHRPGIIDAQAEALDALAARTTAGPPLVVGTTLQTSKQTGPPLYNAAVVLRDGSRAGTYHKRLLPTYDVFDEHRYFEAGDRPTTLTVDGVDVGITICEDAWHDTTITGQRRHEVDPLAETAQMGADLIVTPSASPFSIDKPTARAERFIEHAERTGCPVVFVNQVGGNDELIFDGNSIVATAEGIVEQLERFGADTRLVDVPLDGSGRPTHRPDTPPASQVRQALRLGVSDYFDKTGFEEAVIGLSGGIDSSVTAALTVDALGADAVYGVSLPSHITSQQSVTDARAVAENLGIEFDVVPVGPAVDAVSRQLDEHAEPLSGIAAENIQARIRGDVLMGLANERNALVLTPDNKSEAAVGYCTLYGDAVGALAPLGDCYKRVVYELAAAFNDQSPSSATASPVIPETVLEKEPTAELREDQTDADELPSYEHLDPVLEAYIEGTPGAETLRETYPEEVVDAGVGRVTRSEFKRRQTPPPLRVTTKALGRGWNYPIAAEYGHVTDRDE